MISITIPIKAISKDNEKIFNRQGRPFTSKKYKDFEKVLRAHMIAQLPKHFTVVEKEGIEVSIYACFKNKVRCDLGNIPKGILDAGNGVLWKDDKLITSLHSYIQYGKEGIIIYFNEIV